MTLPAREIYLKPFFASKDVWGHALMTYKKFVQKKEKKGGKVCESGPVAALLKRS